jgi:hypothetical protein
MWAEISSEDSEGDPSGYLSHSVSKHERTYIAFSTLTLTIILSISFTISQAQRAYFDPCTYISLVIPSGSNRPIPDSISSNTPNSCISVTTSSISLALDVVSATACFLGIVFPDDRFLGGGLMGGVFFGLAGARGTLKTVSFWGVVMKVSLSASVS